MVSVLGLALAAGLLPGSSAASPPGRSPQQPQPTSAATAGDESGAEAAPRSEEEALAEAERTGEAVEVTSRRGESSELFATPDGKLEGREYLRPIRARVDGDWQRVDTDLAASEGGMVAPKVATIGLEFSGGGDAPLVRMERTGRELEVRWPKGELPTPQLTGDTAVYPEVLPGVDLRLSAQVDGFSQLLVVKSAQAAASTELSELRLGLDAAGMTVRETSSGGLEAVDAGARTPVFEASTPLMWDSSEGAGGAGDAAPSAKRSAALEGEDGGDGEPAPTESGKLAPVGVEVPAAGDELVLTPDEDVLRGEDTAYPVFIDPQWHSPRASAWTMASRYWSSSPQWKFNGESNAGLGYCGWAYCKPQDLKRLFYRIPTSRFAGKDILSAEFVVRNVHSASCTDREVQLWRTKGISSSTTWNSQSASGFWVERLSSKSFAYGYEGCASKDAEFSVKAAVQEAASKKWSSLTFGMKATSESDKLTWKRFSDKAHLRVKYNRPPYQVRMSQLTMEYGGVCKSSGDKARVRTLGKVYASNIKDPDRDHVAVQFQAKWDTGDGKGLIARWKPGRTTYKKSGSDFAVSLPSSVPENRTVHWYVRVYDGAQYSSWSAAGSPTACYFVRDTKVPKAPSISSGEYPASDPGDPDDPWYDGVGRYGFFALDASDSDVNRYRYGINGDPSAKRQLSTSGGAAKSAKVLPGKPGLNFVTAQAFDEAGNGSEIRTYQFRVKAGQPERATWQFDEDAGGTEAEGSTPGRKATVHGGVSPGDEGAIGTAATFNGTDGYATTDIPVVNNRRGFTVSAWVRMSELTDRAAIIAAQPGNHAPGFELYYSAAHNRWVFNHYASDDIDAKVVRAMADQPGDAHPGEWTHLVGSYDGVEKHLRLFVNGKLAGQTDHPSAWEARRGLRIGAGSYGELTKNFFPGQIDSLQIFDKRIAQSEVDTLHAKGRVGDPGRPAIAVFDMEEAPGATELAAHGDVLPAKYHGGVTAGADGVAGKSLSLNGTDGHARVASPHVNSSRSFSVSAWAKLEHKTNVAAIITAQAGEHRPGFELYYSADLDKWAFNQYDADDPEAKPVRATQLDGQSAHPGDWAHLVGVHDTLANTLTLYVNGTEAGSTELSGAFYADGPLQIGAGNYSGEPGRHFPGQIDDLRLFDRPVSAHEAQQLFQQRPVLTGRWQMDDASDPANGTGTTPDAGPLNNDATLHGDARIDPSGAFMGDNGLLLDGVDDYAQTGEVPVDTSKSFTVTAWVRAAAELDEAKTAVSATGDEQSAFTVGFVPDPAAPGGAGLWQMGMSGSDSDKPAR
ncbi:LamG domain-containing protein, partial [Streptomyces gossypii]|uniref:LamG domain-containing protein n=1 Tax=Streptomyces gossypii TaxID=2883101 RepID=UPI00288339E4